MASACCRYDDYIEIHGVRIDKPFVEKPADAEDHNVYIYYPESAGGGSKRLFRKVGNQSSAFYPHENTIRRHGSFIYEEFLPTEGTDVKVSHSGQDRSIDPCPSAECEKQLWHVKELSSLRTVTCAAAPQLFHWHSMQRRNMQRRNTTAQG